MLTWIGVCAGVVLGWGALGYLRQTYFPRRRLRRFLQKHRIDFSRISSGSSYGWPVYVVVFDSIEKSTAFRESASFAELLCEVQSMHGDLKRGDNRYDATMAVAVVPFACEGMVVEWPE